MCGLCYTKGHTRSQCTHRLSGTRFCAKCGQAAHDARTCTMRVPCRCCENPGHTVLQCELNMPQWEPIQQPMSSSSFPRLSSSSSRAPSSSYSCPTSPSVVDSDDEHEHDMSRASRLHKRHRSISFDRESIDSYESRNERTVSPAFQHHLDKQSLTRRASTPSPSRSCSASRSSSRSSRASSSLSTSSSVRSARETQLELQVQQQQLIITQLQKQIETLTQQMNLIRAHAPPPLHTTQHNINTTSTTTTTSSNNNNTSAATTSNTSDTIMQTHE